MFIDWDNLMLEPPTKAQRHALYRLGVSRTRVHLLQSTVDADKLIKTLLKTDPRNNSQISKKELKESVLVD